METWAWAAILAILSLLGLKIGKSIKDSGRDEAQKKAKEREDERADELAKRFSDSHDINTHFGVRNNGDGKDTEAAPRFEIPHPDRGKD
jgi:hypothetical protein